MVFRGSRIRRDAWSEAAIAHRIALAEQKYADLKEVIRKRSLGVAVQVHLLRTIVWMRKLDRARLAKGVPSGV